MPWGYPKFLSEVAQGWNCPNQILEICLSTKDVVLLVGLLATSDLVAKLVGILLILSKGWGTLFAIIMVALQVAFSRLDLVD